MFKGRGIVLRLVTACLAAAVASSPTVAQGKECTVPRAALRVRCTTISHEPRRGLLGSSLTRGTGATDEDMAKPTGRTPNSLIHQDRFGGGAKRLSRPTVICGTGPPRQLT